MSESHADDADPDDAPDAPDALASRVALVSALTEAAAVPIGILAADGVPSGCSGEWLGWAHEVKIGEEKYRVTVERSMV